MPLTDAQIAELKKPLDPAHVKKPTGSFGPKGDYIEGWHAINELNRVFGFDGWSYTIDLTRDALEKGKDSKGAEQWQAAYTCICTLTVAGVTRQDVGFGSGFAKGIGDAIEGATKEAVTDALKRAARTFGNIFGLALYDKTRVNVVAPEPEPVPLVSDETRDEIAIMAHAAGVGLDVICQRAGVQSLKELTAAAAPKIINKLKATMAANADRKAA
jgi:DNA recombination protein Rad52